MSEEDDPPQASSSEPTVSLPPEVASGAALPGAEEVPDARAVAPTLVDGEVLSEAIRRGLITPTQARAVAEQKGEPRRVTERLVKRGLMEESQARALEQEVARSIVPGYVVEKELGRGGMGVVYKARQTRLDRAVALKVVSPQGSSDLDFLRRFELEAKALGRLNHPHIVQVYDCGESGGRLYIALEFVDGRDCQQELEAAGPFPPAKALQVIREAALGLRAAHQGGIIHRDVKPGNILLVRGPDGALTAKIADLGLALLSSTPAEGRVTQAGTIMGSPAYMAPEQTRAEAADHRSDIYALGATLYHLLGGKAPFSQGGGSVLTILSRKMNVQLDPPSLPSGEPGEPLLRLLDRMLARPAGLRYQTWDEVIADLDALLAGREPSATRVPREHSSLRLGAPGAASAAPPTVRVPPAAQAEPRPGEPPLKATRPSPVPLLIGGVVLAGLAAAAFLSAGGAPATGGQGTPGSGLDQLSAEDVAHGIEALEGLAPAQRLADEATVAALVSKLATLPAGAQVTWRPRLRAALDQAVEATEPARIQALEASWSAGEWARLSTDTAAALAAYARWEREPPARLRELAAFAGQAARDGAGDAERAAWAAAQAAADPRQRLGLLERFEERFPFSPALTRVQALRREADAAAPEVSFRTDPVGARLSIDGREVGAAPWSGRLPRGEHVVRAEAAGHFPMTVMLALEAPLTRTLVLGPIPARSLVQDTERGRPLIKANKFQVDWTFERGEWKVVQGGVSNLPVEGGWSSIRRDLAPLLQAIGLQLDGPWQLQWLLPSPTPGATAEVRCLAAEDGRSAVLGWRDGQVYLGLRGPGPEELDVRAWGRFGADRPAGYFQLDWDGQVVVARTKQGVLGALALPWRPASACCQLAVRDGAAEFTDMQLYGLRDRQ